MIFFVILWTYICILLVWIRVGQWQILHLMPAPPSLGWSQTRCSPQLDRKPSQTGLCPAQRLTISTAEMELDRIRWRKKLIETFKMIDPTVSQIFRNFGHTLHTYLQGQSQWNQVWIWGNFPRRLGLWNWKAHWGRLTWKSILVFRPTGWVQFSN